MTRLRHALSRTTVIVASLLLIAAMAGLTWGALLIPPVSQDRVGAVNLPVAVSDVSYVCPSAPENTIGAINVPDPTASASFTVLGAGATATLAGSGNATASPLEEGTLNEASAGGHTLNVTPSGQKGSVDASGAVAVSSANGDLRGLSVAPCKRAASTAWIVGGSGAVGNSSQLRLTNPGTTAVTATIHMYGSIGELSLPRGGQVAVPAGKTVTVSLESSAGEDARLAVSVEAEGGDLAASIVTESLDGETPAGIDILTPGAGSAKSLIIPGVVLTDSDAQDADTVPGTAATQAPSAAASEAATDSAGDDSTTQPTASSTAAPATADGEAAGGTGASASETTVSTEGAPVVRIANPSATETTVTVALVGPKKTTVLPGAQNIVIDPKAVVDVLLTGVPAGTYGVRVDASSAVAAAARVVRHGDIYPEVTGSATSDIAWIQGQSTQAMARGSVTIPHLGDGNALAGELALTNPGNEAIKVRAATTDGSWSSTITVPAGTTRATALTQLGVPQDARVLTLEVDGDGLFSGALVLTQEVTAAAETPGGTLIGVLPVSEDVALESTRSVILR